MTTQEAATIPVVTNTARANYPFAVQIKATENWGTHDATVTLAAARETAIELQARYPALPLRIEHCTGGLQQVQLLPKFKRLERRDEVPHRTALWSGVGEPPQIGSRVEISINGIGPGTVKAYAVSDGYLGVMVEADEATRPEWHKQQNPVNGAFLTFGAELRTSLADLYALWDKLCDVPVDEEGRIDQQFYFFEKGTTRERIWKWFEARHPRFVVGDVLQGARAKD